MPGNDQRTTVGELPSVQPAATAIPALSTRAVWVLWAASVAALVGQVATGAVWRVGDVVAVDGLTALMWVVVTTFSAIVHSYARRYMAGSRAIERFFGLVAGFTVAVMVLVAADHVLLFLAAWVGMGLLMAELVGYAREWDQARAAAAKARRAFLASGASLAVALGTLWWATGATTISGALAALDAVGQAPLVLAATALVLAAMIQSALVPFHSWLLSSMTAPTPASALMHAGFVNAGGVLLARFAPVVTAEPAVMGLVVAVGATSAILGKLMKSVQPDVKGKLGCSTVGQMGFMVMQAGLGFFGAALTHLVVHGCYKAYLFLSSGSGVAQTSPDAKRSGSMTLAGGVATVLTALAGGGLFALLTGKGTKLDGGLLLAGIVVVTTLHATRSAVAHADLPAPLRYGGVAAAFLPAIAVYAAIYRAFTAVLADVPAIAAPAELSAVHGVVAAAFLAVYVALDADLLDHSTRLYVALVNAAQPDSETLLTATEEYNEH